MPFEVLAEIKEITLPGRANNFIDVNIVEITGRAGDNPRVVIDLRQSWINESDQKMSTKTGWALSKKLAEQIYEALGEAIDQYDEVAEETEPEEKPVRRTAKKASTKKVTSSGKKRLTRR